MNGCRRYLLVVYYSNLFILRGPFLPCFITQITYWKTVLYADQTTAAALNARCSRPPHDPAQEEDLGIHTPGSCRPEWMDRSTYRNPKVQDGEKDFGARGGQVVEDTTRVF